MSEPRAEYHFKPKEDLIQIPIPGAAASRMMNGSDDFAPKIRFLVEGFTL